MTAISQKLPFEAVMVDESGGNIKTPQGEFLPEGRFAVVDQGKELIAGYVNDESRLCLAQLPVIVFGDHTRCFKYVDFPFCMGADGIKILRPKIAADVKYLYHYLRQLRFTEGGYDRHYKYLKRTTVVIPPLSEQRRISALLDKADAIRVKRQQAICLTEDFLRSAFLDLFGDPVTNPKGWPTKNLGDLVKIIGGGTPSRSVISYYQGNIRWATSKDMKGEELLDTKEHISEEAISRSATTLVQPGTLLIVVKSKILLHNLPVLITTVPTCFNQDIKGLINISALPISYIARHLRVEKKFLLNLARGANTEGLTLDHLRNYKIMIPPSRVLEKFERLEEKTKSTSESLLNGESEADNLFNSLSQHAFRGEL